MGLLDKAGGLTGRFKGAGEETVRVVDYDKRPEKEKREKPKPAPKEKIERAPRKKLSELLPKKGSKEVSDAELDELPDFAEEEEDDLPLAYKVATDTAFDIDDEPPVFGPAEDDEEDFGDFEDLPESGEERSAPKEEIEYDEVKIKDVLEVLKIPSTYIIASDVLMPEDFKAIEFDLQVPQGYDIGQVEFFVERAEGSIAEYLKLLEERNNHIAKLATTVDRLQVDLENLKFDSQIAAGIGIMPTSDNDELERDNLELRLQVKRLEDKLKAKTNMPDLSSKERQLYEDLRNQYSILEREKSNLEQENSDLRVEIARMEEEQDDPTWMAGTQIGGHSFDVEEDTPLEGPGGIEYMDEKPKTQAAMPSLPDELPSFGSDDEDELPMDGGLPDFSMELPSVETPSRPSPTNSSFDLPDEFEVDSKAAPSAEDDDDDDDELSKLMKGWS